MSPSLGSYRFQNGGGLLCLALELLSYDQVIFIKAFKLSGDSETQYTIPKGDCFLHTLVDTVVHMQKFGSFGFGY